MAVTHVATNTATSASTSSLTIGSLLTQNVNRAIIVKIAYKDNSGGSISSVVFNGSENLTLVGSEANGGDANSSLYQLAAPTATTADVVITLSASERIVAAASSYHGVDQTNPLRASSFASATGTDATPTVDVLAISGDRVVDSLCQVSAGPDVATADHTVRHNTNAAGGGTDVRGASQFVDSSGATETMGWSMTDSDDWAVTAAALQEPVPPSTRRIFVM